MCAHLVEGLGVRVVEGLGVPRGLPSITSWESEAPGASEVGLTRMNAVACTAYSSCPAGIIQFPQVAGRLPGAQCCSGLGCYSPSPCPPCTYQLIGVLGPGQVAHL